MHAIRLSSALAGLLIALHPVPAPAQAHADTVLLGGKVWTGDPARPEAQALATEVSRRARNAVTIGS